MMRTAYDILKIVYVEIRSRLTFGLLFSLVFSSFRHIYSELKSFLFAERLGTWEYYRRELPSRLQESYYIIYAISVLGAIFLVDCWQLALFWAFFTEVALIIASAFYEFIWLVRLFLAFIWIFVAILSDCAGFSLIKFLRSWTEHNGMDVFFRFNETHLEFIKLTAACHYWWYYFLVFFLPFASVGALIFAPLMSGVYAFFFGFLLGYILIGYVASFWIFLSFLGAMYLLLFFPVFINEYYALDKPWIIDPLFFANNYYCSAPSEELNSFFIKARGMSVHLDFGEFIDSPFFRSNFEFGVDSIACIMAFTITLISFLVHVYAISYMKNDPHTVRFFGLLSLFTFFMLLLVISTDLIMLFIGWEGVGLISYLLISFWYTRVQAQKAATKAILMNKIGDLFLLFSISIIGYYNSGNMSIFLVIDVLFEDFILEPDSWGLSNIDYIALALLIAALIKSAQFFFHTWLPDAMEGPTPVSALLHAATMVTAGVYLVIRFSYLFEFSLISRYVMLLVSVWTIATSSFIAMFQYDIKKIIAYSTCGQLGIMFLGCSLSGYDFALFHFFNHAFFKCLLFLLAGAIIHELRGEQDIRAMGRLSSIMPVTFSFFVVATLSLAGFPSFSGSVSKDLILGLVDERIHEFFQEWIVTSDWSSAAVSLYFLKVRIAVVFFTSAYMARLIYYVFYSFPNFRKNRFAPGYVDVSYTNKRYMGIFLLLSVFSIFGGRVFKYFFVLSGGGYINIHNDMLILNADTTRIAVHNDFAFVTFFWSILIIVVVVKVFQFLIKNGHVYPIMKYLAVPIEPFSLLVPNVYNAFWFFFPKRWKYFYEEQYPTVRDVFVFFNRRCFHDDVYNLVIARPLLTLSLVFRRNFEHGIFSMISIVTYDFVYEYKLMYATHGSDAIERAKINFVMFICSAYFLLFF